MEGSVKIALSYQQNIQFIFPCYVFTKFEFVYRQISYDNGSQNLNVHVMECQNLKKMDTFGKSDPYVKVYLLPGGFDIMKTDVIKKNLNPYFNAMFRFNVITSEIVNTENFTFSIQVAKREIMNKTIVFQVFDWEKIGKEEAIGEESTINIFNFAYFLALIRK